MCGIVGYVGKKRVVPIIIDGLRRSSVGRGAAGPGHGGQRAGFEWSRLRPELWLVSPARAQVTNDQAAAMVLNSARSKATFTCRSSM